MKTKHKIKCTAAFDVLVPVNENFYKKNLRLDVAKFYIVYLLLLILPVFKGTDNGKKLNIL